jgi:hypothetical protein
MGFLCVFAALRLFYEELTAKYAKDALRTQRTNIM